jgi:quaternary ammonium compound-resistance protein SugE
VSWFILVVSGVFEAVWASALARSENFARPIPSVLFAAGLVASMAGLSYAMRELPVGTTYAVWVGIGASLTVAAAMVSGDEPVSALRLLFLGGIVASVIGLKLTHS